mgnify:CR=1 FL=1
MFSPCSLPVLPLFLKRLSTQRRLHRPMRPYWPYWPSASQVKAALPGNGSTPSVRWPTWSRNMVSAIMFEKTALAARASSLAVSIARSSSKSMAILSDTITDLRSYGVCLRRLSPHTPPYCLHKSESSILSFTQETHELPRGMYSPMHTRVNLNGTACISAGSTSTGSTGPI